MLVTGALDHDDCVGSVGVADTDRGHVDTWTRASDHDRQESRSPALTLRTTPRHTCVSHFCVAKIKAATLNILFCDIKYLETHTHQLLLPFIKIKLLQEHFIFISYCVHRIYISCCFFNQAFRLNLYLFFEIEHFMRRSLF